MVKLPQEERLNLANQQRTQRERNPRYVSRSASLFSIQKRAYSIQHSQHQGMLPGPHMLGPSLYHQTGVDLALVNSEKILEYAEDHTTPLSGETQEVQQNITTQHSNQAHNMVGPLVAQFLR